VLPCYISPDGGGGTVAYTVQYRMKEWIRKEAVVAVSGDAVETTNNCAEDT
jgi:hypothetical protein